MSKKKGKGTHKLPKRIAGVKVPKTLRKSGGSLGAMASSPLGKEIVASGLIAIAATIAGSDAGRKSARQAKHGLKDMKRGGEHRAGDVGHAVATAVNSVMERWLGGQLHWQPTGTARERTSDEAAAPGGSRISVQH